MAKWRLRYWTIFAGQALSLVGSGVTQFILVWWTASTFETVSSVAMAGIAVLLPQAVLAPLGGVLADRYSRRILLVLSDLVSALVVLGVILLFAHDAVEPWHLYVAMCLRSAMQAIQGPSATASVAMLVPSDFLPRAAGFQQTIQGLMTVGAAPLGAIAITTMPIEMALAIDLVTALTGILPLLFFRIPQCRNASTAMMSFFGDLTEGIQAVVTHAGLLRLYGLIGAVSLTISPTFVLLPLLVIRHFRGGAYEVALMEGLTGGAMMVGGAVVAYVAPRRFVVWALTGLGLSCLGLALAGLVPPRFFGWGVTAWAMSGFCFSLGNAPLMTLLQAIVSNEMQGRLISLLNMTMGIAAPVGLVVAVPLADELTVRWIFVLAGVLGCAFCLIGLCSRSIRSLGTVGGSGQRK